MEQQPHIDAHVHILPAWRLAGLMRWILRAFPEHPVAPDIDRARIESDLAAGHARLFFNLVYPLRPRETHRLNAFNFELTQALPHCAGWGSLHPETQDKAAATRHCIQEYGFLGMKFHPFVQGFSLTDPAMHPVYDTLCELRRPLFLHTGFDEFYKMNMPPEHIAGLARQWPDMPIILSHMMFPRLRETLDLMDAHPQLIGDLTNVPGSIRWMAGLKGKSLGAMPETQLLRRRLPGFADRLIYGSDHPAGMGGYADIYADFHALELARDLAHAILWRNPLALVHKYLPGRWDAVSADSYETD